MELLEEDHPPSPIALSREKSNQVWTPCHAHHCNFCNDAPREFPSARPLNRPFRQVGRGCRHRVDRRSSWLCRRSASLIAPPRRSKIGASMTGLAHRGLGGMTILSIVSTCRVPMRWLCLLSAALLLAVGCTNRASQAPPAPPADKTIVMDGHGTLFMTSDAWVFSFKAEGRQCYIAGNRVSF